MHLVHRDIKPANIRITPQGEVKLLDFGIARAEFQSREAATVAAGFGTLMYMAPERFRGEDTAGGDVYALAVTLFQMLTGEVPGESAGDVDRRPPGKRLRPQWAWLQELSPDLVALLVEMLQNEPEDRPNARDCARRMSRISQALSGEVLEDWAPEHVPAATPMSRPDKPLSQGTHFRVGMTIGGGGARSDVGGAAATMSAFTSEIPTSSGVRAPKPKTQARGGILLLLLFLAGCAALLFVVTATTGVWYFASPGSEVASVTVPAPTEAVAHAPVPGALPASTSSASPAVFSAGAPEAQKAGAPVAQKSSTAGLPPPSTKSSPERIAATSTPTAPPSAPVPTPEVAPVPEEAPAPVAAPAPPPKPAAPTTGVLALSGDALRISVAGISSLSAVPPGTYAAKVTFSSGVVDVPGVTIVAGKTTRVTCMEKFATCRVSPAQ